MTVSFDSCIWFGTEAGGGIGVGSVRLYRSEVDPEIEVDFYMSQFQMWTHHY